MKILQEILADQWNAEFTSETQSQTIAAIESGRIIYFPKLFFPLLPQENPLLTLKFSDLKTKNISYHPLTDTVRGTTALGNQEQILKHLLQRFANHAKQLMTQLFPHYATALEIGRTSFRPIEIAGRKTSYRKDDTRLHVDAFPATPNQGKRILRVFTNINPDGQNRQWRVGDDFINIAQTFSPKVSRYSKSKSACLKWLKITKTYRTAYDHMMLQIHDRMKADLRYQAQSPQQHVHFAPGTSWIVQTDQVSHAAMRGQHVLEQTFYLPVEAMQSPHLSPLRVLEKLTGKSLV